MAAAVALLAVLAPFALAQGHTRVNQELSAGTTVGKASAHARAISCTNGGWLSQLRHWTEDDRVAGFEICCGGTDSAVWYEGGVPDKNCAWFGIENERAEGAPPPPLPRPAPARARTR